MLLLLWWRDLLTFQTNSLVEINQNWHDHWGVFLFYFLEGRASSFANYWLGKSCVNINRRSDAQLCTSLLILTLARREEEPLCRATHSPKRDQCISCGRDAQEISIPFHPAKNQTRKQAAHSLLDATPCTTQQVNCRVRCEAAATLVTSTRVWLESHEGVLFAAPVPSERRRRATSTFFVGAKLVVSSVSYPNYKTTAPTSDSTAFMESLLALGWKMTNPGVFFHTPMM